MANNQIGWSQESMLLNQMVKQLQRINKALGSISLPTTTSTTTLTPTTTTSTTIVPTTTSTTTV